MNRCYKKFFVIPALTISFAYAAEVAESNGQDTVQALLAYWLDQQEHDNQSSIHDRDNRLAENLRYIQDWRDEGCSIIFQDNPFGVAPQDVMLHELSQMDMDTEQIEETFFERDQTAAKRPVIRSISKDNQVASRRAVKKNKGNSFKNIPECRYNYTRLRVEFLVTRKNAAEIAKKYNLEEAQVNRFFNNVVRDAKKRLPLEFTLTREFIEEWSVAGKIYK